MTEPINMADRLAQRIKRAADILHRYTSQPPINRPLERAINDAFNVLEWGKTLEQEAAEAEGE